MSAIDNTDNLYGRLPGFIQRDDQPALLLKRFLQAIGIELDSSMRRTTGSLKILIGDSAAGVCRMVADGSCSAGDGFRPGSRSRDGACAAAVTQHARRGTLEESIIPGGFWRPRDR
jgi:hypothetical protein